MIKKIFNIFQILKEKKREDFYSAFFALCGLCFFIFGLLELYFTGEKALEFIAFGFALYAICQTYNDNLDTKEEIENLIKKVDQILHSITNTKQTKKKEIKRLKIIKNTIMPSFPQITINKEETIKSKKNEH